MRPGWLPHPRALTFVRLYADSLGDGTVANSMRPSCPVASVYDRRNISATHDVQVPLAQYARQLHKRCAHTCASVRCCGRDRLWQVLLVSGSRKPCVAPSSFHFFFKILAPRAHLKSSSRSRGARVSRDRMPRGDARLDGDFFVWPRWLGMRSGGRDWLREQRWHQRWRGREVVDGSAFRSCACLRLRAPRPIARRPDRSWPVAIAAVKAAVSAWPITPANARTAQSAEASPRRACCACRRSPMLQHSNVLSS